MSVLERPEDAEQWQDWGLMCFYCVQPLTEFPAIHWLGADGHIYFHPKCLINFQIRTTVDLYVVAQRQRLDEDVI